MAERLVVGGCEIAVERRAGRAPGLFWLGGFRSDMQGTKAGALDSFGAAHGLAVTRFDYSGHGRSGGDVTPAPSAAGSTKPRRVRHDRRPAVVVGSSMGGWLALLLVRELRRRNAARVKGLVLIAPATDMTELMLAQMDEKKRDDLRTYGFVEEPSAYADAPYRITLALVEDGRRHLLFGRAVETGCPVTILQGARDTDVPREHTLKLVQHLVSDPVTLTLVREGDHRLSRDEDLALLGRAIEGLLRD